MFYPYHINANICGLKKLPVLANVVGYILTGFIFELYLPCLKVKIIEFYLSNDHFANFKFYVMTKHKQNINRHKNFCVYGIVKTLIPMILDHAGLIGIWNPFKIRTDNGILFVTYSIFRT